MALSNAYLVTTKNLDAFLNALIGAQAPERFSTAFLQQLDFTSSNDRLFITLLKSLGFLDDSGAPTERYYRFLDQGESGVVLAEAVREAYSDLFAVNKKANELSVDEVKNKLRTLTQGKKSEKVMSLMANTFKALSDRADWTRPVASNVDVVTIHNPPKKKEVEQRIAEPITNNGNGLTQLHYNIQIHLPDSRDQAVFDAIFRSIKQHLT